MKATTTLGVVLLCFLPPLRAEKRTPTMQRFGESEMQTIKTQVRFTTMLNLPPGEEISEVICGDKEFWVIEGKGTRIYVKPSKEGAQTNIIITTKNNETYTYLLREVSKVGATSKEKPDFSVMLDVEEFSKLKKDKENLLALLADAEKKTSNPAAMRGEGTSPKKADSGDSSGYSSTSQVTPAIPVTQPEKRWNWPRLEEMLPPEPAEVTPATPNPVTESAPMPAAPNVVTLVQPPVLAKPDFTEHVVERTGFFRRAGRSLWSAICNVNRVLRIY